jgi:hypothetical protein
LWLYTICILKDRAVKMRTGYVSKSPEVDIVNNCIFDVIINQELSQNNIFITSDEHHIPGNKVPLLTQFRLCPCLMIYYCGLIKVAEDIWISIKVYTGHPVKIK